MMYRVKPLTHRSARKKFEGNVKAIQIAKSTEPLSDEDRDALASYCGWGDSDVRALGFDWTGKAKPPLDSLLTPAEVASACRSTINAHYTDPQVADAIWRIAVRLLHRSGLVVGQGQNVSVLEPSCGSGMFLGTWHDAFFLWPSATVAPRFVGVEMDEATAQIAARLYPEAKILCSPFERANLPSAYFDLVIGNVPFADVQVSDDSLPSYLRRTLHDYFVCKAVTHVKPGGIVALITSVGTLDKQGEHVRRWLSERCLLLGALRLPGDAFEEVAGTQVTTDVLFLQRLPEGTQTSSTDRAWVASPEHTAVVTPQGWDIPQEVTARLNAHYLAHPARMLGTLCRDRLAVGGGGKFRFGLVSNGGNLWDRMAAAAQGFAEPVRVESQKYNPHGRGPQINPRSTQDQTDHIDHSDHPAVHAALAVHRAAKRLLALEASGDSEAETARRRLNVAYDLYHRQWGRFGLVEHKPDHPLAHLREDPRMALLLSIETPGGKAPIFTRRALRDFSAPTTGLSPQDALYRCLDAIGHVDLEWIARASEVRR